MSLFFVLFSLGVKRGVLPYRKLLNCPGKRDTYLDGDGDIDIVSKIWRVWPGNGNNGRVHIDWLENLGSAGSPR